MGHTYQLLVDGAPVAADLYAQVATLEVEENAELPGAIQLTLPVAADGSGDLTRDDRLETVAQDIVRHFLGRVGDADNDERRQPLEEAAVDLGDAEVVLDDERADLRRGRGAAHRAGAGMRAVKTAPPSFATRTQPPLR